jgi:hypothetical protein
VSVAVTDQSWKEDADRTCGPWLPLHGSWLTPRKFVDDCWPARKPGAWPEDGPAFQEPQPDALVDARAAQLAVNTARPAGARDGAGADLVRAGVAGSATRADLAGAGDVRAAVGRAFGAPLVGLPVVVAVGLVAAVDIGVAATVGKP